MSFAQDDDEREVINQKEARFDATPFELAQLVRDARLVAEKLEKFQSLSTGDD